MTRQYHSTQSLLLVFSLFLLLCEQRQSHCGADRSNSGQIEPSSSHLPLEDIPQEALVRRSVHMRRGFVRAVIRHFSVRSAVSKRKRKIKTSNSTRLLRVRLLLRAWRLNGFNHPHSATYTAPTTTFTAWLHLTHCRRGQSFTTSHERNDVIVSFNFEQINAVEKKKTLYATNFFLLVRNVISQRNYDLLY